MIGGMKVLTTTQSTCPDCSKAVHAELIEVEGQVFLRRDCSTHRITEALFRLDAAFFRRTLALRQAHTLPEGKLAPTSPAVRAFLTTLAMDVTTRCNMECPTCVSKAENGCASDPPIEQLLSWVPDFTGQKRGFRPNISLIGGESLLRDDLEEIIRGIVAKGLVPRLNTNGLLLLKDNRLDRLWDAGLRWVILQFDGFTPGPSLAFRGKDYTQTKLEIIDALAARGFAIHLATMVQRGVNDHEIGDILRFAVRHPSIHRVSFYPRSRIGRFTDNQGEVTHLSDVFAALEKATGNQVTREDLLDAKRIGNRLFQLTKNPEFRQRICIYPFVLLGHGDELVPVSRLVNPGTLLRRPGLTGPLWRFVRSILRLDRLAASPDLLFVYIEKFYDTDAFDWHEAHNCHHIYLTAQGNYPFCVYNTYYRGRDDSQQ